ncbi:MAG: Hsp20/alpha crystallin family protein [Solirubrobacteraceae bacterium]
MSPGSDIAAHRAGRAGHVAPAWEDRRAFDTLTVDRESQFQPERGGGVMLTRFDPYRNLAQFAEELTDPNALSSRTFPVDAYRRGNGVVLLFDLPGVDPQSIDLTVDQHVLTVRAERSRSSQDGVEVLAAERPHGEVIRRVFLADTLDMEQISAAYRNGVLELNTDLGARKAAQDRGCGERRQGTGRSRRLGVDNVVRCPACGAKTGFGQAPTGFPRCGKCKSLTPQSSLQPSVTRPRQGRPRHLGVGRRHRRPV